jgi:hypothetical protein
MSLRSARESLISNITAGDGKTNNLFYSVVIRRQAFCVIDARSRSLGYMVEYCTLARDGCLEIHNITNLHFCAAY